MANFGRNSGFTSHPRSFHTPHTATPVTKPMLWETSVTCDSTDLQVTKPKSTGNDCCLEGPQHEMPLQTKNVLYFQGRFVFQSSKHLLSTFYDQTLCYVLWPISFVTTNDFIDMHESERKLLFKKKNRVYLVVKKDTFRIFSASPILGKGCDDCLKRKLLWMPKHQLYTLSLFFNQVQCFSILIVTKNYDYIPIWLIAFLLYQQFYSSNKQLHS